MYISKLEDMKTLIFNEDFECPQEKKKIFFLTIWTFYVVMHVFELFWK